MDFTFQVCIGKKDKVHVTVARSEDGKELEVGDMCLLDVPKWVDHWPLLGEVMSIGEHKVNIRWWRASMTGVCKPEVLQSTRGKGRMDWCEDVGREQIWLFGFHLTPSNRFSQAIREKIEKYDDDF